MFIARAAVSIIFTIYDDIRIRASRVLIYNYMRITVHIMHGNGSPCFNCRPFCIIQCLHWLNHSRRYASNCRTQHLLMIQIRAISITTRFDSDRFSILYKYRENEESKESDGKCEIECCLRTRNIIFCLMGNI